MDHAPSLGFRPSWLGARPLATSLTTSGVVRRIRRISLRVNRALFSASTLAPQALGTCRQPSWQVAVKSSCETGFKFSSFSPPDGATCLPGRWWSPSSTPSTAQCRGASGTGMPINAWTTRRRGFLRCPGPHDQAVRVSDESDHAGGPSRLTGRGGTEPDTRIFSRRPGGGRSVAIGLNRVFLDPWCDHLTPKQPFKHGRPDSSDTVLAKWLRQPACWPTDRAPALTALPSWTPQCSRPLVPTWAGVI